MHSTKLVTADYYKASYEDKKHFWQDGFLSYLIAKHAHGGHSHEELTFKPSVIAAAKFDRNIDFCGLTTQSANALTYCIDYGYSVCFSSSYEDGGCRFKCARAVVEKHPDRWDTLPVTDNMDTAVRMLQFCIAQDGKKYDWPGVFSFKLSFIEENSDKWYCSEVCDTAKRIVGLWPQFYRSHPSESYWIQKYLSTQSQPYHKELLT